MPSKRPLKSCQCGASNCTETTKSTFFPGHDSKLLSAIKEAAGGDILALKGVVEASIGKKIVFKID